MQLPARDIKATTRQRIGISFLILILAYSEEARLAGGRNGTRSLFRLL
jgi:hypothetical protein